MKRNLAILLICLGVNLGLWGKTIFPDPITTKGFKIKSHIGQVVKRGYTK